MKVGADCKQASTCTEGEKRKGRLKGVPMLTLSPQSRPPPPLSIPMTRWGKVGGGNVFYLYISLLYRTGLRQNTRCETLCTTSCGICPRRAFLYSFYSGNNYIEGFRHRCCHWGRRERAELEARLLQTLKVAFCIILRLFGRAFIKVLNWKITTLWSVKKPVPFGNNQCRLH